MAERSAGRVAEAGFHLLQASSRVTQERDWFKLAAMAAGLNPSLS